jgi:hypothetical protein
LEKLGAASSAWRKRRAFLVARSRVLQRRLDFLGAGRRLNVQDIEVARLLGWTEKTNAKSNKTARACSDVAKLIVGGY